MTEIRWAGGADAIPALAYDKYMHTTLSPTPPRGAAHSSGRIAGGLLAHPIGAAMAWLRPSWRQ